MGKEKKQMFEIETYHETRDNYRYIQSVVVLQSGTVIEKTERTTRTHSEQYTTEGTPDNGRVCFHRVGACDHYLDEYTHERILAEAKTYGDHVSNYRAKYAV